MANKGIPEIPLFDPLSQKNELSLIWSTHCSRKVCDTVSLITDRSLETVPFVDQLTPGRHRVEYRWPVPAAACGLIEMQDTCKGVEFCCAP